MQLVNDTVRHFLSFPEFDVVIFAYDEHDWLNASLHPWAALSEPRIRIVRGVHTLKYAFAKRYLER